MSHSARTGAERMLLNLQEIGPIKGADRHYRTEAV